VKRGGAGLRRYSRKDIENLEARAREFGAAGLIWIKKTRGRMSSSILKAVGEEKLRQLWQTAGAQDADLVLLVAGAREAANAALGQLRTHLARAENWIPPGIFRFAWILDFPLFEFDRRKDGTWRAIIPSLHRCRIRSRNSKKP